VIFTWTFGIIGAIYSALFVGGFPTPIDFFSGFIAGALIDLYYLLKREK
jgi:hypothetical protein